MIINWNIHSRNAAKFGARTAFLSLKTNRFEITDDEANTPLLNAAWPRRFCTPQSREEREGLRKQAKGKSVSRDVWRRCVAEGFSARWALPKQHHALTSISWNLIYPPSLEASSTNGIREKARRRLKSREWNSSRAKSVKRSYSVIWKLQRPRVNMMINEVWVWSRFNFCYSHSSDWLPIFGNVTC